MNLICKLLDHQYRTSVPRVFEAIVYCKRCGKQVAHFDSPVARQAWETDPNFKRKAMGG